MDYVTKKKFWLVVLSCFGAIAFTAAVVVGTIFAIKVVKNEYILELSLAGDSEITIQYGETYEEPGFSARFYGTHLSTEPIPVEVVVENSVDDQKVGEYVLNYTATHKEFSRTVSRKVCVVDEEKPVITLVSDPKKYTLPTETYEEEGFTATDNYDGDITHLVKRTEEKDKITYSVTDSSGNKTEVIREIVYDDPTPPKIALKGKKTITITLGTKYKEPGYTAKDNCDGNLTKKVKVTGSVDTTVPGNYKIKYTVKDSYGNKTTVSRVVRVKYKSGEIVNQPAAVVPKGKVIYLTFDDGPGPRTPDLLKVLKKYNVKATFFVVNTDYVSTIKQIAKDGHALAIHCESHNYRKIYASESSYFKDLDKMKKIIKDLTGVETTLLRFPGGSSNTVSSFNRGIMTRLTKAVVEKGYQYFDWNVDSEDASSAYTSYQVYRNVISGVKNRKTSIVLQHDVKGFSVDAVEDIILWGLHNGYTFLPLQADSPGSHHSVNN